MISMKQWMDAVGYRITEGSAYCWECFGPNAHVLDSWDGNIDGFSTSIVFDTQTQVVYEATVCDYAKSRAYRLHNHNYAEEYRREAETRSVPVAEAWDDVEYVDLTVDADFMEKLLAVVNGEPYDNRIQIELELPDAMQLDLMRRAHAADMTLNDYVAHILMKMLNSDGDSK